MGSQKTKVAPGGQSTRKATGNRTIKLPQTGEDDKRFVPYVGYEEERGKKGVSKNRKN